MCHVVSVDQQVGHGGPRQKFHRTDVGERTRQVRGMTCVIAGNDEGRSVDAPEFFDYRDGAVIADCHCGSRALGVSARNSLGDEVSYERLEGRNEQLPRGL